MKKNFYFCIYKELGMFYYTMLRNIMLRNIIWILRNLNIPYCCCFFFLNIFIEIISIYFFTCYIIYFFNIKKLLLLYKDYVYDYVYYYYVSNIEIFF